MRIRASLLPILFAACASTSIYAQGGFTGTWRIEGAGAPFPWEVALRADGSMLEGVVSSCFSGQADPIFDGVIDGSTIKFKCQNGPGTHTISFTGEASDGKIVFSWVFEAEEGTNRDARPDALFGSQAPPQFTVKQVPDGELAKARDNPHGWEYAAAFNLVPKDLKVEGMLWVPQEVDRVRAILVVINFGLGYNLSTSPEWRRMSQTLGAALLGVRFSGISPSRSENAGLSKRDRDTRPELLLSLLQRLAQESGHRELTNAPFLFWGHSGAAGAATEFARQFPDRTIAFVRYHIGAAPGEDVGAVSKIPALILTGGKEFNPNNAPQSESLWKRGRAQGAPWTFGIEPEATHGDPKDLENANRLIIPWIAAVVQQRLSPDSIALRSVPDDSAWMGSNQSGEIAPNAAFTGSKADASWLPDEASARQWQAVLGLAR